MTEQTPAADEVDITEAMRITGKTRDTLMRWKRDGKVTARVETRTRTQRQRRILFLRSDIEKAAGAES
jgi:hypothetical protein